MLSPEVGAGLQAPGAPQPAARPRCLVLGVLGSLMLVIVVSSGELIAKNIQIGMMQLAPAMVGMLFALVLMNESLGRLRPSWRFTPTELTLAWLLMMPAPYIASRGLMEKWLPLLVGVKYFGPANRFDQLFWPYINGMLVPWDPSDASESMVVRWFYEGLPGRMGVPWLAWLTPIAVWLILILAMLFAYLCIVVILRRHWVENEKLPFPLVQLPLELLLEPRSFLRNPVMWGGFIVAFGLFTLNGLSQWFPSVPQIPVQFPLNSLFTTRPYNAMTYFAAYISPAAIGFFYLMPTDLLLSFWLFYLLAKGQEVLAAMYGENEGAAHAAMGIHVTYQGLGAFVVIAVMLLYGARKHLSFVMARAVGRAKPDAGEAREMFGYPLAVWGLVGALVIVYTWCVSFGMSPGVVVWQFGLFLFVQALVQMRNTAEGGMLITEGCGTPSDLVTLGDRSGLGARNLTMLAFMDGLYARDTRGLMLTGYMDAQKATEQARLNARRVLAILAGGTLLAIGVALIVQLWLPYHYGANNLYPYVYSHASIQFFRENAGAINAAGGAQRFDSGWLYMAAGAVVCGLLSYLRLNLPGFPLHPLGYAMCATWGVVVFWASMLIAWLIKVPLVHYGGMKTFRLLRPFFLGLVFGEFLSACCWSLIAWFLKAPTPTFPWP